MLSKPDILRHMQPLAPIPTGLTPRGGPRAAIRSVLFDVYGTLFISASGDIGVTRNNMNRRSAMEDLLRKYHIHKTAAEILGDFYAAIETAHAAAKKTGIQYPEVDIVRIWRAVLGLEAEAALQDFAIEFEIMANPVYPMPNLLAVLQSLRNLDVAMGLISNAQFYTPLLFDWFCDADPSDLGFRPDLMFFSYRFGRAKPSPVLFAAASEALKHRGVADEEVLYVGNDMLNDIYPAHELGFQTALFAGDRRSLRLREDDARCRGLEPEGIITDLIQLIDWV